MSEMAARRLVVELRKEDLRMILRMKMLAPLLVLIAFAPNASWAQYNGARVSLDFRNRTSRDLMVEYEVGGGGFSAQRQRIPLAAGSQLHDHHVRTNSTLTVTQDGRSGTFAMDRHFNVIEFTGFDTQVDPWRRGEFQVHLNNLTDHPIDYSTDRGRQRRLDADLSTALNLRNRTTIRLTLENRAEYVIDATQDTDIIVVPRAVFVDGRKITAEREGQRPDRYRNYQVKIDNRSSERVSYRYETNWGDFTAKADVRRNDRVNFEVKDHNELEVEIGGDSHLFVISRDTTIRLIRGYVFVCLLYTSPSPRDRTRSRMPSSA